MKEENWYFPSCVHEITNITSPVYFCIALPDSSSLERHPDRSSPVEVQDGVCLQQ